MARTILTYADYAALPDDGRRYELHEGELSVTPAPGVRHQRVSARLFDTLRHHVETRRLGEVLYAPVDCILTDSTVVQPDIVYVSPDLSALISERAIEGAPTLAVEILSPSSERIDRQRKLDLYARHGVPYYWIVDPAARVIVAHVLTAGAYHLAARLAGEAPQALPPFDGLRLDPAAIWA
jgi:Uma2 family endonuclease